MRAVQQEEWGGPEVLRVVEMDRPKPLPTEVLVRVMAAGVNPVDRSTREGHAYMQAIGLPFVPGWDVAGVVAQLGYGVTRFERGEEVYGMPCFPRQAGGYAEYMVTPARHLSVKPAGMSFAEAAALPMAGLTAWQMLVEIAGVQPGQRVLVNAAAGGVGHLAVQIAKTRGAHVIATARSAKHEFVRSFGADQAIDYTTTDVAAAVRDVDVVIELVGGETCLRMLRTLRPGGLLVSAQAAWAPTMKREAAELGVRARQEQGGHPCPKRGPQRFTKRSSFTIGLSTQKGPPKCSSLPPSAMSRSPSRTCRSAFPGINSCSAQNQSSTRTQAPSGTSCSLSPAAPSSAFTSSPEPRQTAGSRSAGLGWIICHSAARQGRNSRHGRSALTRWASRMAASSTRAMDRASHSATPTTSRWSSSHRPADTDPAQ